MTERLLQFIWQMQYFNKTDLHTTANESLQIIHPGHLNTNQGPDFQEAGIRINTTTWAGNIELHVKASDWKLHRHDEDKNYKNIILYGKMTLPYRMNGVMIHPRWFCRTGFLKSCYSDMKN